MKRQSAVVAMIAIAVLLASGLAIATAIVLSLGISPSPPSEEDLVNTVAAFLEVEARSLDSAEWSTDRHGVTEGWILMEDEVRARCKLQRIDGELRVVQMTKLVPQTDLDMEEALEAYQAGPTEAELDRMRAIGAEFAAARYDRWGDDMQEVEATRVPMGQFTFTWKRFTDAFHETGDFVSVSITNEGDEVYSYVANYATRATPPRLDAEAATQIAIEDLQRQSGMDADVRVTKTRCVLSLPRVGAGPVWFVSANVAAPQGLSSRRVVMVDGKTGAVLETGDLR